MIGQLCSPVALCRKPLSLALREHHSFPDLTNPRFSGLPAVRLRLDYQPQATFLQRHPPASHHCLRQLHRFPAHPVVLHRARQRSNRHFFHHHRKPTEFPDRLGQPDPAPSSFQLAHRPSSHRQNEADEAYGPPQLDRTPPRLPPPSPLPSTATLLRKAQEWQKSPAFDHPSPPSAVPPSHLPPAAHDQTGQQTPPPSFPPRRGRRSPDDAPSPASIEYSP